MANVRLVIIVSVSVVVTALVMGGITRPAQAETPKTVVCTLPFIPTSADLKAHPEAQNNQFILSMTLMQGWMNAQLAAGHTSFSVVPLGSVTGMCAW